MLPHKTSTDWTLMTAATIPDSLITIRDSLFVSTFTQAYWPNSTSPLPVAYNATNGKALSGGGSGRSDHPFNALSKKLTFCSSPILGASFAAVALQCVNAILTFCGEFVLNSLSPGFRTLISASHDPALQALLQALLLAFILKATGVQSWEVYSAPWLCSL